MINGHLRGHASRAAGCTPSASPEVNQRSRQRGRRRHRYTTMKKGISGSVSVHGFYGTTASRGRDSSVFSPPVQNHRKLAQSAATWSSIRELVGLLSVSLYTNVTEVLHKSVSFRWDYRSPTPTFIRWAGACRWFEIILKYCIHFFENVLLGTV